DHPPNPTTTGAETFPGVPASPYDNRRPPKEPPSVTVKDSGARDGKAFEELSTGESSVSSPATIFAFSTVDKLFSIADVTLLLTVVGIYRNVTEGQIRSHVGTPDIAI